MVEEKKERERKGSSERQAVKAFIEVSPSPLSLSSAPPPPLPSTNLTAITSFLSPSPDKPPSSLRVFDDTTGFFQFPPSTLRSDAFDFTSSTASATISSTCHLPNRCKKLSDPVCNFIFATEPDEADAEDQEDERSGSGGALCDKEALAVEKEPAVEGRRGAPARATSAFLSFLSLRPFFVAQLY